MMRMKKQDIFFEIPLPASPAEKQDKVPRKKEVEVHREKKRKKKILIIWMERRMVHGGEERERAFQSSFSYPGNKSILFVLCVPRKYFSLFVHGLCWSSFIFFMFQNILHTPSLCNLSFSPTIFNTLRLTI